MSGKDYVRICCDFVMLLCRPCCGIPRCGEDTSATDNGVAVATVLKESLATNAERVKLAMAASKKPEDIVYGRTKNGQLYGCYLTDSFNFVTIVHIQNNVYTKYTKSLSLYCCVFCLPNPVKVSM